MLSLMLAALLQVAPAPAEAPDNGLPKDDYSLVAWCHGALAGQLELDSVAMADMEKIEGKAKVADRRKADAEMEKERRQYLKDYEHALAAAEAASPTMIHAKGVAAEQQGYRMWSATRNKEPIWRMLDWGMWDPNDAGCSDAAKRLYDRSSLFGEALKGSATSAGSGGAVAATVAEPTSDTPAVAPAAADPSKSEAPVAAPDPVTTVAAPAATRESKLAESKTTKRPAKAKAKAKSAEAVRAAIADAPPTTPTPTPTGEAKPTETPANSGIEPATATGLRGPQ